tara:strand:- start:3950 stop:5002 length:1053 start_codon:yes stop_codon:yes gene_type:complete
MDDESWEEPPEAERDLAFKILKEMHEGEVINRIYKPRKKNGGMKNVYHTKLIGKAFIPKMKSVSYRELARKCRMTLKDYKRIVVKIKQQPTPLQWRNIFLLTQTYRTRKRKSSATHSFYSLLMDAHTEYMRMEDDKVIAGLLDDRTALPKNENINGLEELAQTKILFSKEEEEENKKKLRELLIAMLRDHAHPNVRDGLTSEAALYLARELEYLHLGTVFSPLIGDKNLARRSNHPALNELKQEAVRYLKNVENKLISDPGDPWKTVFEAFLDPITGTQLGGSTLRGWMNKWHDTEFPYTEADLFEQKKLSHLKIRKDRPFLLLRMAGRHYYTQKREGGLFYQKPGYHND